MRRWTTVRSGMLGCVAASSGLLGALACGGEKGECTTIDCIGETPPPAAGQGGSGGSGAGLLGPGDLLGDVGAAGPGPLMDGDVCQGVRASTTTSAVNVLILLDRSVSMLDSVAKDVPNAPTRWDAVTAALQAFVNSDQAAEARVGLQFFGLTNDRDDCGVAKYATPVVPVAPLSANRSALLTAINGERPGSFTPTAPAVQGALEYTLALARQPENAGIPSIVVLASDGMPSECGPTGADGMQIVSVGDIISTLESYSRPPLGADGSPAQPPIRTYLIGTEELSNNAIALARAGDGQAFLVGGAGLNFEAQFLDALLRIVVKPLSCELDVPQNAPGTGEAIDFDQVRVRFTGANSGLVTEFPRADGPASCGVNSAWYYDDPLAPKKIVFCRNACQALGAGDLQVELGCAPATIVR